ncbi:MAG: hypothetical protein FJ288_16665 [Planctomycetes bacterium]|nr:hypothetical protein [Planctomycetota bacterium]
MAKPTADDMLDEVVARDRRYARDAYIFVHEALEFTVRRTGHRGHVTGRELCEGLCRLALEQFGRLARTVLAHWGVRRSEDVGEIVFNMVEVGLLRKRDEDRREDFAGAVDFQEALDRAFELHLKPETPDEPDQSA